MKIIVQRVSKTSLSVANEVVSKSGAGIFALVGIHRFDNEKDVEALARKLMNLRIFSTPPSSSATTTATATACSSSSSSSAEEEGSGEAKKAESSETTIPHWRDQPGGKSWSRNVMQCNLDLQVVSQFTLCHELKGNKPDYHNSMSTDPARKMFDGFVKECNKQYDAFVKKEKIVGARGNIVTGAFGEHMSIETVCDGPVTITLESELGIKEREKGEAQQKEEEKKKKEKESEEAAEQKSKE